MKTHDLKTWPEAFQDMWLGLKDFEVRLLDRLYEPGDTVRSQEWHHHMGYTGREITAKIKYILPGGQFGIEKGYGVLGLIEIKQVEGEE